MVVKKKSRSTTTVRSSVTRVERVGMSQSSAKRSLMNKLVHEPLPIPRTKTVPKAEILKRRESDEES